MKLIVVLSLVLGLAACEKSSNTAAWQDEATGLVSQYGARLELLQQRRTLIDERSKQVPQTAIQTAPDLAALRKVVGDTNNRIAEMQKLLREAPEKIKAAAGAPPAEARAQLRDVMGELHTRLEVAQAEVTRNFDLVETWLSRQGVIAAAAPAPAPAPEPAPEPEPEPDADADDTAAPR
jgi:ATP/maltotriose-dependent transcriptional regulator MalT